VRFDLQKRRSFLDAYTVSDGIEPLEKLVTRADAPVMNRNSGVRGIRQRFNYVGKALAGPQFSSRQ
jgi:hypothetical protein